MKKHIIVAFLCLLSGLTYSCKDDDNKLEVDEEWRDESLLAFDRIAANSEYTELKSLGNDGEIYYKVLEPTVESINPGTEILWGDKVKCHYTFKFFDGTVEKKKEFDDGTPEDYMVNYTNTIKGLSIAFQNMKVGDRWEIWIPYQLGYGVSGRAATSTSIEIKPYTTLVYQIEVIENVTLFEK